MRMESKESKRQYVLEQAILGEMSTIRGLFDSARYKWEPEEDECAPTLTFEQYLEELKTLKTKIIARLDNLLKSVTASYSEVRKDHDS